MSKAEDYEQPIRAYPKMIFKFISYNNYVNRLYKFFANTKDIHSNDVMYNYAKLKLYIKVFLVQQIY